MNKIKRDPKKFETFELFSTLIEDMGYNLNDPDIVNKITSEFKTAISSSSENNIMIYGKRVEGLFSYIARGLSEVNFIKQEDSGDAYTNLTNAVKIPDFRILLKNQRLIFVEVKNNNKNPLRDDYKLKIEYVESLQRYCDLNSGELFIAVYYRLVERFVLVSVDCFENDGIFYTLNINKAFINNKLDLLGDCKIALKPPLQLHLKIDSEKTGEEDEESYILNNTIRSVSVKCCNVEITDDIEKSIAYKLMWYGTWEDEKVNHVFDNQGLLKEIQLDYYPVEYNKNDDIELSVIAEMSHILIKSFTNKTTQNEKLKQLSYTGVTLDLNELIPYCYTSEVLPLIWLSQEV